MVTRQAAVIRCRQDALIERVYRRKNLVSTYANVKLLPPEATAFIRYRDDFVGRRVLDMGCGAGRLAVYLRPLIASYTGFDVSPFMIEHCRREFDDCHFVEGDMRDLSTFHDASFDTIVAVSNLFDAVSHPHRLQVLSEVRRTLARGGLLFFSAHNRNFKNAGVGPRLLWHRNPLTQLHLLADYWSATIQHRRLKALQRFEDEYALINDSGNNYSSLHYYVGRDVQLQQLASMGFETIECLDARGHTLSESEDDSEFPSIHYVARRLG
jgi:SAM-dependent methyltransferase